MVLLMRFLIPPGERAYWSASVLMSASIFLLISFSAGGAVDSSFPIETKLLLLHG